MTTEWQPIDTLVQDGRQIRLKMRNGKTCSAPAKLTGVPVEVHNGLDFGWFPTHWAEIDPNHCPMCGAAYLPPPEQSGEQGNQ